MKFDFDKIIDRNGTDCIKYDFKKERSMPEDVLPLWVADMDFETCPGVIEALEKSVRFGVFGYSDSKDDYVISLKNWFGNHFNWEIDGEWLVKTPGVVFAVTMAVQALTNPGDGVMIQQPVYYPFKMTILNNNRKLVNNPLVYENNRYRMDYEDFERKIIDEKVKLFILCNPHNPVGRVWRREELERIGAICLKHKVMVVSDEIHCDFVHKGYVHTVFSSLSKEISNMTITCTAPSKTFNIASLQTSNIFVENQEIRDKIKKNIEKSGYGQLNQLGMVACKAAYDTGEEWLVQLKEYIDGNIQFAKEFIEKRLPQIKVVEPEGTYLLWLDLNDLGLTPEERYDMVVNKAKLWLDNGEMFGEEGTGFERINLSCPRKTLEEALLRLEKGIKSLKI